MAIIKQCTHLPLTPRGAVVITTAQLHSSDSGTDWK